MNLASKETVLSRPHNTETPDQAYLMRVLFESFRHGQGSLEVQLQMFRNVASKHADWHLIDEQKSLLEKSFSVRMTKFFQPKENPRLHRKVRGYIATVEEVIEQLQIRFNEDRNSTVFNINTFAGHLVGRDHFFTVQNKRRPRKSKKINERNPILDPYLSYVCYFGIEGNTTGIAEFDDLYSEVKEAILERPDVSVPQLRGRDWKKVVEKYVLTHPSKRPLYEGLGLVQPQGRMGVLLDRIKRVHLQYA